MSDVHWWTYRPKKMRGLWTDAERLFEKGHLVHIEIERRRLRWHIYGTLKGKP